MTSIILAQTQPTGQEIVDRMVEVMSPENSRAVMTQTIITTSGQKRTFEFEMFSGNKSEKILLRYRTPTSVRGQTFLMLNHADDIWTFFPRTRRVRKLATHAKKQKVQGSDFSYEDFTSSDTWKEDYTTENFGEVTEEGIACWRLKAMETEANDSDFPRVMLTVRQDNYHPLKLEYFNEDNVREKTMFMNDIRDVDGIPTAHSMVMKNHLEGTQTEMNVVEMSYDWTPPPGFFSERNLRR